ncbi:uncharacterized protein LOC111674869 [Lucilia cuprina]|uniref:uncharacterized protein LOC111674869 n=1 Tax=Lucilia cuprina TaxID=7375 RepID=UPI001F06B266|nr:uncharacterized protein LOC111674869 [Lucilia cuprina]
MILKHYLLLISMLLGSIITTAVVAYPQYEDEGSHVQAENIQTNGNDEIYEPALLQQHIDEIERKTEALNHMDVDMESKTEVTLKNVRNISDNQLSNEYISIENEVQHDVNMPEEVEMEDNTSIESTEQNSKTLSKEEEYETENPTSKKIRMGRLFTTTTVPEYIRKLGNENPTLTARDTNVSNSDYVEDDDDIVDHTQRKPTTKIPINHNLDNSSEENDEIVPLAMKYYDEIPPENASSSRHVEHVSSEDYYEEEVHETESTTADNILLRTLFAGPTTPNDMISITAPTPNPQTIGIDDNNPTGQFDLSLFTTSAPLPPPPQSQTQTVLDITSNAVAVGPVLNDKKAKQIPIINTVPVVTTIATTSSRRRLLPYEQLRNYVEDAYIRMPLAVIVDTSVEALAKTKALWNDAMRSDFNVKIVMVTLNKSEELPAAFYFNNTRQFLTGLNSIKAQYNGDAFRGISYAASLVPYDSAIFISTAHMASNNHQVQNSAITLLKKRIRLYLIWFGNTTKCDCENETQNSIGGILGEVATRSGGEILHIVGEENSQELAGRTHTIVADALRGSQEVDVPVDTTLSSLHVKIDKLMRRAVLETPNGEINLKKLVKFKTHSLSTFDDDDKRLDAYVPLTKLRKATVYKLKMIPEDLTTEYSVFIRGERKADTFLDDMIKHFEKYYFEGHTSYPAHVHIGELQQSLAPEVLTHANLKFPTNEKSLPKSEVETFSTHEIHRNAINSQENNISSLAATTAEPQQRNTNILQRTNTKIEMGIQSQILIAPGMLGQLYFEVTNTGYEAAYYNIQVVDERRYLMRLTPQSFFLRPGQMTTVTVTVLVPQNAEGNTIDHITFSTTSAGTTTSLTLNLKVITTIDAQDNTLPSISWNFGNRCEGISSDFDSCSERFWSMYITAQDWQTGIMRLQATPSSGLIYTKSYTIGTTEPLKATYVASCCEPKVSLVAFDVAGNQRSHTVDVRDLVLTEASIAAIALGAILLILLIILLIASIVWCCRRRKIVLDLPTYRSHSTRSME